MSIISSSGCLFTGDKTRHSQVWYSMGFKHFPLGKMKQLLSNFGVIASLSECESVKINTHTSDKKSPQLSRLHSHICLTAALHVSRVDAIIRTSTQALFSHISVCETFPLLHSTQKCFSNLSFLIKDHLQTCLKSYENTPLWILIVVC